MYSLNQVSIIGNVGNEPELKYAKSGDAIINLSIATSEKWKDKSTGEDKEVTEWHKVVAYGKIAEILGNLRKGSKVYIQGSLSTRKWQDKDGQDRYTTEIKARDFMFLDSKSADGAAPSQGKPAPASVKPAQADAFDGDLPF